MSLSAPIDLLPAIASSLKAEPYTLAELCSDDCFGVHPNTLFEGARAVIDPATDTMRESRSWSCFVSFQC
jgi:hypothetical protein